MGRASRLLAALLLAWAAPAQALRVEKLRGLRVASSGADAGVEVVAEEVLVKFDPAATAAQRLAALAAVGGTVIREMAWIGWTHVRLPAGFSVATALGALRGQPGILEVAPNHVYRPVRVPNDPQYSAQYHLGRVSAFSAWEYEVGTSSRVTIAVIDAGIQGDHPDLLAKLTGLTHQDCTVANCTADGPGGNGQATYACNHGTRVAGVAAAAADNGTQVAGISWGARILSLRVFDPADCTDDCNDEGGNDCGASDSRVIDALEYVTQRNNDPTHGKIVVNMSLGCIPGSPLCGTCSGAFQTALDNAATAAGGGIVLVAAAGNHGPSSNTINKPGACNNVIPVGATDANDDVASFSSRGPELNSGGVVAPGVTLLTTDINSGTTGSATGTSFAAPVVAGLAALIRSARPEKSVSEIRTILRSSTDGLGLATFGLAASEPAGNSTGSGRVNAFKAMRLAINGTLADFEGNQKAIAFPNPFRPSQHGFATITIPTSLAGANPEIRVYTMDGQLVRKLAGQSWDGKNDEGVSVASGVYLFTVKTDNGLQRGRVAVLR